MAAGAELGEHAARFSGGSPGVLHGAYSYLLQDDRRPSVPDPFRLRRPRLRIGRAGARLAARSGPRRVRLRRQIRRRSRPRAPWRALEGIIPALESAHAVAEAIRRAPAAKDQLFVINLSGRGDKDTDIYRENLKELDEPDQNRPAL